MAQLKVIIDDEVLAETYLKARLAMEAATHTIESVVAAHPDYMAIQRVSGSRVKQLISPDGKFVTAVYLTNREAVQEARHSLVIGPNWEAAKVALHSNVVTQEEKRRILEHFMPLLKTETK